MEKEVMPRASFLDLIRKMFIEANNPQKQDEEESKVSKAFEEVNEKLDAREENIRSGGVIAKVRAKASVNQNITVSKEKSLGVKKAEMKKGSTLREKMNEQQIGNEGRERDE